MKCYECGCKSVEDLSEEELGNPNPEDVQHYQCDECGAFYLVILEVRE